MPITAPRQAQARAGRARGGQASVRESAGAAPRGGVGNGADRWGLRPGRGCVRREANAGPGRRRRRTDRRPPQANKSRWAKHVGQGLGGVPRVPPSCRRLRGATAGEAKTRAETGGAQCEKNGGRPTPAAASRSVGTGAPTRAAHRRLWEAVGQGQGRGRPGRGHRHKSEADADVQAIRLCRSHSAPASEKRQGAATSGSASARAAGRTIPA